MRSALDPLVRDHSEMASAATVLRILASALPDVVLPADVPNPAAAEARLDGDVPALEGEPLLTGTALLANLHRLTMALAEVLPATAGVSAALAHNLAATDLDALATMSLAGAWDMIGETAHYTGLDATLFATLVDHAARPALRAGAAAVRELTARHRWTHAMCPCCGAPPFLAELRSGSSSPGGAEQERVLRCGRCLAAWPFPRLRCIGCGETNHQRITYLHAPGEAEFRRAEACSSCGTYLKSIAVLAPLTFLELLDHDLATAALDVASVEQGLHRHQ
jgi:FdhE protein